MSFQTISAEAEHTATAAADYPEDGDTHEGPRRSSRPKKPVHHPDMVDPRRMTIEQFYGAEPLPKRRKVHTPDTELLLKNKEEQDDEEPFSEEENDKIVLEGRRSTKNFDDCYDRIEMINEKHKRVNAEMSFALRTIDEACATEEEEAIAQAEKDHEMAIGRIRTEFRAEKDQLRDEVTRDKEPKLDVLNRDMKDAKRKLRELKKAGYHLG